VQELIHLFAKAPVTAIDRRRGDSFGFEWMNAYEDRAEVYWNVDGLGR
jgi:hypothetical protein